MSDQPTTSPIPLPPRLKNLAGLRVGRLAVVAFAGWSEDGRQRNAVWRCLCDCGKEAIVRASFLQRGAARSCGCLKLETIGALRRTHGMFRSPEYIAWRNIKARCFNPKNPRFVGYGGRGIKVCDRWRDSFENFLADMGLRPSPKHTIERKDNNGHYEPGNVIWATKTVQNRNKRDNHLVTFRGESLVLADWEKRLGISRETLRARICRLGWSVERAFTTPANHSMNGHKNSG